MTGRNRLSTVDDHDHRHHHESEEEKDDNADASPVCIFDAAYCGEPVPKGFNGVKIQIDGRVKTDLSWKHEREAARIYAAQGLHLFWEIDLGVFKDLPNALGNTTQFLALGLSIEHFCATLWKEFRTETVGLCLYRGTPDFSLNYPWDEEQERNFHEWKLDLLPEASIFGEEILRRLFCSDAAAEYLKLLASRISDRLPLFLLFDVSAIQDVCIKVRLLAKERYSRFHLGVKDRQDEGTRMPHFRGEIAWEGISIKTIDKPRSEVGFCLPCLSAGRPFLTEALQEVLKELCRQNVMFRVIPEGDLAVEWDGLDYLIVDTQTGESPFKRKLQGFCAAGGTVVCIGPSLGLPHEIPGLECFLS